MSKIVSIEDISDKLKTIFKEATFGDNDEKLVNNVLEGFPESISTFGDPTGTVYAKGSSDFWNNQGRRNVPKNINTILAVIINGTEGEAYKRAVKTNDRLLELFRENKDWFTLNGLVRATFVVDNIIYIENKNGLRTTVYFALRHEIYK